MATPIFVIGRDRSGTHWLSNQLCQHPLIAGVGHERHHGVLHSAYFNTVRGRYGDLSDKCNYIEFVEVMSASDFICLAGITKGLLYSLWPTTYERFFRTVMDEYAKKQGAAFWLDGNPGHTPFARTIAAAYPDAKFIAIERALEPNVASHVGLARMKYPELLADARRRQSYVIKVALWWAYYRKLTKALAGSSGRALVVKYEALRVSYRDVMRRTCSFLGVACDSRTEEQAFEPNTSFMSAADRISILSRDERRLVRRVARVARLVPLRIADTAYWRWRAKRRLPLPCWFFRLTRDSDDGGPLIPQ